MNHLQFHQLACRPLATSTVTRLRDFTGGVSIFKVVHVFRFVSLGLSLVSVVFLEEAVKCIL